MPLQLLVGKRLQAVPHSFVPTPQNPICVVAFNLRYWMPGLVGGVKFLAEHLRKGQLGLHSSPKKCPYG
jgi:hypothetical protein